MSISSEISRISQNVSDSLDAVALKGVTVPAGSNSDDLPGLIAQITGSGVGAISIVDTADSGGGVVRTITAIDISNDTVTASHLESGYTAHDASGNAITGSLVPGANCPTFTATNSGGTMTVTCDWSYSDCFDIVNEDSNVSALLVFSGADVYGLSARYETNKLIYTATDSGVPTYEITYNSNGTITFDEPAALETLSVTTNGTYTAPWGTVYNEVDVDVDPTLETVTNITPTESSQTIEPTTGYDGLASVQINAISSSYVGSGITRRSSTDLGASGDTVTVPAGYYSSQATKAVSSGTAGTPTATKGTVSSNSVSVTPSVTNVTGYITGGTKTGTAVTVSASELVSGNKAITAAGTGIDVTNYATASVAAGTVTAPSTISGTSATVSTGTNTLTLTKTVSVTPTVSTAGYVSSGTAGNSSVSLTASVNTRSSSDLTASTLTVTAPAGYYASSASKTLSDENLVAGNIKKNVEIFGVTGTYEGGGGGGTETIIIPEQTITASSSYTQIQFSKPLVEGDEYTYTVNGNTGTVTCVNMYGSLLCQIYINGGYVYFDYSSPNMYFDVNSSSQYGTYTVKLTQQSGGGGGSTLIEKSITANGVYNAADDDADGYSKVTVNVSGGSSKNVQVAQSTTRRNNTALGSIVSLTCSTTGTYDVYWDCSRSNTSQTWGSQLYIGGTAYGTENTTWSNNVQTNHLENVSISANQTVEVYGRSRSGYYIYAPQLTIVQN